MKPRTDIKTRAQAAIREKGKTATFAGLVFVLFDIVETYLPCLIGFVIPGICYALLDGSRIVHPGITFVLTLLSLFVMLPLQVGYAAFCLRTYRGEPCNVRDMYRDGLGPYGRNLGGMLRMCLFVMLWSLLLIVPGIVKAISYSMTQYIMAENGHIGGKKAMTLSMRITDGRKTDIFVFCLSFLGWALLIGITMGLLGIYTVPYRNTSFAGLYHEMKLEALHRGTVSEADFN